MEKNSWKRERRDKDNQNQKGYCLYNNISTNNYYGIYIWNFGTTDWPDESIMTRDRNQFTDNSVLDVWIEK